MPLHAEHVPRPGAANRLDPPVGLGPGLDAQIAPQGLHRLVVDGIDARRGDPRIQAREPAARFQAHLVQILLVSIGDVAPRLRHLLRDVLVERPAVGDVDELRAAAHAEHRLARLDELVQQLDLVLVAQPIPHPLARQRLLAVGERADVRAPLKHEAVEVARVVRKADVAAVEQPARVHGRHHQHQHIARHEPVRRGLLEVLPGLALQAPRAGLRVQDARRDADLQRRRAHAPPEAVGQGAKTGDQGARHRVLRPG